jgi:hypothetical protein
MQSKSQIRSIGIDLGKTTFHLVALGSVHNTRAEWPARPSGEKMPGSSSKGRLGCQICRLEILNGKAKRAPEEALIRDVQANSRAATDQSGRDLFQTS